MKEVKVNSKRTLITGEDSDSDSDSDSSLPMVLLLDEIFPKLPVKSIARFRCVSKLCRSMPIRRLLFALQRVNDEFLIFSSPQPHQKKPSSSPLVASADFHMKICQHTWPVFRGLTSRLIYFSTARNGNQEPLIYNPITGEHESLPELSRYRKSYSFIGFDPIGKQFKLLFMAYPYCFEGGDHRVMTLGNGEKIWREVKCSLTHLPVTEGICIDGVLYYVGENNDVEMSFEIVCFDVRSEEFKFVSAKCFSVPHSTRLVNYKGKLGGIELTYDDDDAVVLTVRVLEDGERCEWLEYVYTLPENEVFVTDVFVVGMTGAEEIVLSDRFTAKPFYVFYFDPERNTLQAVEVRGVGEYSEAFESECSVYAFVDYEVDPKFIT
uniref:F-box protein n=1 Tax=Noccaea caerulescens TaxID=107243 RepID=A0A1J3E8B5_NOCCA